ncbi:putative RNA methyltransferase [Agromyces aureus]|uniref:Uncharacterized protein n=1 Tax=Agromyces aureus TaxID=453304 RepID=A0A191WFJ7_9MICO|nr:methyltransferase domain-containing protein [Agromyces aureus]ANJ27060.1 hypothetical protein ATC03_10315 [Agromyces aureus]
MSFDTTWFRCPNCFSVLSPTGDLVIGCANGHRFDVARQGTVTLLPPRAPRTVGDDHAMLTARAALLDSALYVPIADAIVELAELNLAPLAADDTGPRLVDFGCGTGYYAARVEERVRASAVLLADRSPVAVRLATRGISGATGVVLDIWRPLPLRDASADLALNVFAPRNPEEYARVIKPGGILVVVVPRENHLAELRCDGSVLTVPADKERLVTETLGAAGFGLADRRHVEYSEPVSSEQRAHLVAMGPSAHHAGEPALTDAGGLEGATAAPVGSPVTISVDVLAFRR